MSGLRLTGEPAHQLMVMLWSESTGRYYHNISAPTRRLLKLGYVREASNVLGCYVTLTDEGRALARKFAATPHGMRQLHYWLESQKEATP